MFIWILIIFALAVIFGVIKVETLKSLYAKAEEFVNAKINKKEVSGGEELKETVDTESVNKEEPKETADLNNNQE